MPLRWTRLGSLRGLEKTLIANVRIALANIRVPTTPDDSVQPRDGRSR